jgi:TPR repeat protein
VRIVSALVSFILALCIAVSLATSAASARAADANDMSARLFTMQKALAEQKGDVQAQYYLAQMYEHGLGTSEDLEQARLWYERAAAKGHPMAKRQLQELDRARQEANAEQQRAAEAARAAFAAPHAAPGPQVPVPAPTPQATADADKARQEAEAARRAKDKARAERKRAVEEYLRRQLAHPVGEPFE